VGIDPVVEGQTKITIFPNPVKAKMQISLKSEKPISEILSMEIYNNRGVKVDEIEFKNNSSQETEVKWNKGDLPAGVYYLVIKTEKERLTKKFIIL
jgi:sporulation protein YlmC with PRC-barrel domain